MMRLNWKFNLAGKIVILVSCQRVAIILIMNFEAKNGTKIMHATFVEMAWEL